MKSAKLQAVCSLGMGMLLPWITSGAFGQTTVMNGVLSVSPSSGAQGSLGLTVTFTLSSTATPPVPPGGVLPTSVLLGTNIGSAVTHASRYLVSAQFNLPVSEPVGPKDVAVTFPRPTGGPVTYARAQAFEVTASGSGPLVANFTAAPLSGTAPLTVVFSDTSTGDITDRFWSFGDGTGSVDRTPLHIYGDTGTYAVSLTVSGPAGSNTLTRPGFISVSPPAPSGAYPVVDTGQTNCYGNATPIAPPLPGQGFHGQDAQHASHQPRYLDNQDGTVSDLVTGLMWQQDPGGKVTYAAAVSGAGSLSLGGHTDWRLPTIKELYSLILFSGSDASPCLAPGGGACLATPFLDTNYFRFQYGNTNAGERIIDAQYWSGTEYVSTTMGGNATVFGVNFADGRIKGYPRDTGPSGPFQEFCRYVRGNPGYGSNTFIDNGDGTITDQATWLMWTVEDSGTGLNWSNALAWVEARNALNHLGHSDWRLPDAKELQSILDYTRSPATTDSAAIHPLFQCTPIVNEAGQPDWPYYWSGTTHADAAGQGAWAAYVCFGRAMGYMNATWMDVHGAGAQRGDPKTGSASDYPTGHGPQGDSVRVTNFVRLVRTAAPRQNILLLIADDFGAESSALYNSTSTGASLPPTPNLDSLAQSGVVFRQAYANPLCSPTRSCIMTGRHAFRTGVGDVITGPADPRLTLTEFTLPDAFAANPDLGYGLAQFGKWHLGGSANAPNLLGGWPHFAGSLAGAVADYTNWTKVVNGTQTAGYTNYATTDVVDDALAWIQGRAAQPWFAWVAFNAGHTPYHKPPTNLCPHYASLPGTPSDINANPRLYFEAMIEAMDTEIGRLLSAVNRANTHIIFIGDNGSAGQVIQPPFPPARAKATLYEGGIRVPLIIAGPAVVYPGRTNDTPVHAVDLYATILEMAGIQIASTVPPTTTIDSRSLLTALQGRNDSSRRVYSELFNTNSPTANDGRALRNAQFKLLRFEPGAEEFYDLAADPTEQTNLLAGTLTATQLANYYSLTLAYGGYQDDYAQPTIVSQFRTPNRVDLTVHRDASLTCQLWRAAELSELAWEPVTNALAVTNSPTNVTLTDPDAPGPAHFYRILAR